MPPRDGVWVPESKLRGVARRRQQHQMLPWPTWSPLAPACPESSAVSRAASSETLKFPFASVGGRRLLGAAFLPSAKESGMSDKHEKARRIVEGEIEEYARDRDG
jgi:hypothetical protein